jgi:NAD(P)-dependent dehydrogenase (short-subunit alcohol dehydrogenase family)
MGLITTPFGFTSTALDVVAGLDLSGRRAVVTGAASGIGVETARALAAAGCDVLLAARDVAAGRHIATDITATTGNTAVRAESLDLTDLDSVSDFVDRWSGPLHILVNNAGVMASPETYTRHGWELQLATNHLGHFALATGLHDGLAAAGSARIVAVSSTGHQTSPVIFDDLNFDFRPYDPWLAYGQSKTANVLFAVEATRRWAADGIMANAVMPGAVYTNLQRHTGGRGSGKVPSELIKTAAQGAATSVLAATSPLLERVGGRYFVDCNETDVINKRSGSLHGVAGYALDASNAARLWDISETLVAQATFARAGAPR